MCASPGFVSQAGLKRSPRRQKRGWNWSEGRRSAARHSHARVNSRHDIALSSPIDRAPATSSNRLGPQRPRLQISRSGLVADKSLRRRQTLTLAASPGPTKAAKGERGRSFAIHALRSLIVHVCMSAEHGRASTTSQLTRAWWYDACVTNTCVR